MALSTVDTYSGNPTAAAHRTPDYDADGNPSDRGESGGRDRIENTLGASFSDMGNGRDAYNRLEDTLRQSGHGSQAVIITTDSGGRAHAWNAVNHNGRVSYIDAQTGRTSDRPLHNGDNGVFAIPLDPNRRPASPTPAANRTSGNGSPTATTTTSIPTRRPEAQPAGTYRRPPSDSAGGGTKRDREDEDGEPSGKRPRQDSPNPMDVDSPDGTQRPAESRPHPERETESTLRSGLPADESQAKLRTTHDVYRIEHDAVDQKLKDWAKDGDLARVLQTAAGDTEHPDPDTQKPTTFTAKQLGDALPGFNQLNRGERMAVISTLARLSHTYHQQHGVGAHPNQVPGGSGTGGQLHEKSGTARLPSLLRQVPGDAENAHKHTPDLTGRNYAVLEVEGPNGIEYVVDSSIPGGDGKHSERNLHDWINNPANKDHKVTSLYTEREPCGSKKGALGKTKNCSELLYKSLKGVPVYYSTTYRTDEDAVNERKSVRSELQREARQEQGVKKLDKDTLREIGREVDERVPQSAAEAEMEMEFEARVRLAEDIWPTIASQV